MQTQANKKQLIGLVASDKMQKTVVVEVTRRMRHPVYSKYIKRRKRYHAHDEENSCKAGDRVLIEECRPLSARKRWRVKQILERAV
ncbi:MAG: 30S ribosomal protein S17 [Myxococcota bacterium]|jgi:small subunit ribosomal protein S17